MTQALRDTECLIEPFNIWPSSTELNLKACWRHSDACVMVLRGCRSSSSLTPALELAAGRFTLNLNILNLEHAWESNPSGIIIFKQIPTLLRYTSLMACHKRENFLLQKQWKIKNIFQNGHGWSSPNTERIFSFHWISEIVQAFPSKLIMT